MINEVYVSFEVAKLLKEKGFNEQCRDFYKQENGNWLHRNTYEYKYFNLQMPRWKDCYACPTHQTAMKWLREVHKIVIIIYPFSDTVCENTAYTIDICTPSLSRKMGHLRGIWKTYEEATEAALKYSLENLI